MPTTAAPTPDRAAITAGAIARRRRWRIALASAGALVLLAAILDHLGLVRYRGDDIAGFDQRWATITDVIDYRTVAVHTADGRGLPVRLLGIGSSPLPEEARQQLTRRLAGQRVLLRLEPLQTRTTDGQLLAYIYLDDQLVNAELIRLGLANTQQIHTMSLNAVFQQAQSQARRQRAERWD